MHNKQALFSLGNIFSTPGALAALEQAQADGLELVARHVTGDWAEMDKADQQANRQAVEKGSRVFSAYRLSTGVKVWVISEADRSSVPNSGIQPMS